MMADRRHFPRARASVPLGSLSRRYAKFVRGRPSSVDCTAISCPLGGPHGPGQRRPPFLCSPFVTVRTRRAPRRRRGGPGGAVGGGPGYCTVFYLLMNGLMKTRRKLGSPLWTNILFPTGA